ncbi:PLP-dependent transferase [Suillus weaverae]|nr:PLP-dependent transferase [Suillus weaverae]
MSSESAPSTLTSNVELDKQAPPLFVHAMHRLFEFDPSYVNLNHCSYGSLPMPARVACDKLSTRAEDKFLRIEYVHHWIEAPTRVAKLIGADTDDTILRNFEWHEWDIIIGTNTTYNAVSRAIRYLGDIPPYPQVTSEKSDLQQTRKVVAVVDAIASNPGVRLPWEEMVGICRDAGVWSVVDAAHSAKPDFWVSTCNRWLFAKRSCAVLYVLKRYHVIKSCIPTPRNYYSPQDEDYNGPQSFVNLFEWTGTIDHVPFLSVIAALDFRQWLSGEHKINKYTHNLAIAGGKHLASLLGTRVMDPDGDLTLNMVNWNVYAAHYYHNKKWWTRCSAQIWNEISDFEVLANASKDACQKVVKFAK